ncbi:MAG: hypothetical protein Nkreftii_001674 [Candidatus Nitrospira kreftii]|jgi:hypothetical protein|uniref:Uncharacterized protein n=1 Tax=Candidatus Nitrospira kreftii TaxID=2652173 RepID=A0A7S8IZE1_9BACT|nr:MAG: hypothetical protein Nkreftii_001674 [Candidatus Nitrospira kreftii]
MILLLMVLNIVVLVIGALFLMYGTFRPERE